MNNLVDSFGYSLKRKLHQLSISGGLYSGSLAQEESKSWVLKDRWQDVLWEYVHPLSYIFSFVCSKRELNETLDTFIWVSSFKREFTREEFIYRLSNYGIYLDDESKKLLFKMETNNFWKLVKILLSIKEQFNKPLILTVYEDNGHENLLLLVCFDDESLEEIDDIMDKIYEIIERSGLNFLSATEKFECQSSTGKTF